ncbi:MAG: nicotinate (nicotinamide) nucleotide adenylyltransferase, partial [Chitinophagaceae bacterium]
SFSYFCSGLPIKKTRILFYLVTMKIGLYFGSFNPIHIGHLIIANYLAYNTDLDKVWLVVSPQNPLKPTSALLNEYDRLHLVELAIQDEPRLRASNIEFSLPKPSYTIDTLTYLSEKYPMQQFGVIMGSDSFENLPKWKNYQQILEHYPLYLYQRPGHEIKYNPGENITRIDAPFLDISSTRLRQMIRDNKSIRFLVPDRVANYIQANKYYR